MLLLEIISFPGGLEQVQVAPSQPYQVGEKVEREHHVLVDGKKLVKIDPNTVRLARYLRVLDKLRVQTKES
ncbi:hypothetical protein JHC27_06760 [archaeon]|nr:hypothetical protein [archaeon]